MGKIRKKKRRWMFGGDALYVAFVSRQSYFIVLLPPCYIKPLSCVRRATAIDNKTFHRFP